MLNQIKRELQTNLWSISDILNNIHTTKSPCLNHFISHVKHDVDQSGAAEFTSSWRDNVTKSLIYLTEEEESAISQLGEILGRYSLDEQVIALEKVINTFENNYDSARELYQTKSKISLSIGASVGAIIIILLL